jgi:uncharacterized protein YuzE
MAETMKTVLEYDEAVDALYLEFARLPIARQDRLDDARIVDFAADGSVVGVEILSPSRGVDLAGLPNRADIERVLRARGFPIGRTARAS